MDSRKLEALDKILQARKLEREALELFLPKSMSEHISNINKEVKEMVLEVACELVDKMDASSEELKEKCDEIKTHLEEKNELDGKNKQSTGGVKKVDIG